MEFSDDKNENKNHARVRPPGHTFQPNTMYIQLLFKNWGFYHSKNVFSGLPSLFYESSERLNSNTDARNNKACYASTSSF